MNYFNRIQLDESHPFAKDALHRMLKVDPYSDHQWLWQFFPAPPGTPRDFLFRRFEPQGVRRQPYFYIVSSRRPEPVHEAWCVETKSYEPDLQDGARLAFDLRVNPTQSRDHGGKNKRDDVVMHAKRSIKEQIGTKRWADIGDESRPPLYEFIHEVVRDWFCGRDGNGGVASRNGFSINVEALQVDSYRQHYVRGGGSKEIRFSTVDLSGELEVVDSMAFRKTLLKGVGKAKAFGCGLMLVRRV